MSEFDFNAIESLIGYTFKDKKLLESAFTHSSYANEEKVASNERLEFIGDAVLGYISAIELYNRFPDEKEERLTQMRQRMVKNEYLSEITDRLDILRYLKTGKGFDSEAAVESLDVKGDLFEALIGAVLLDSGNDISVTQRFIMEKFGNDFSGVGEGRLKDPKSQFLERYVKYKVEFSTKLCGQPEDGFECNLFLNGEKVSSGRGKKKKDAEKAAAETFLKYKKE